MTGKDMTTKNATIRLPEEIAEWLTENGKSINQAIIESCQALRRIRTVSTGEIRGVFTSAEWGFLADSFNGTMITDTFRCNVQALIAHCEDSAKYEYLDKKWEVDMTKFLDKIKSLRGANIDAIYARIEDFWENERNLEEWINF